MSMSNITVLAGLIGAGIKPLARLRCMNMRAMPKACVTSIG